MTKRPRGPHCHDIVHGRVEGNTLSGTWRDAAGAGTFVFSLSPDRQTFMGRFGSGEWWTARRTDREEARWLMDAPDGSSPSATLYAFLRAGNEAGEGRSDRLGAALELLDFSAFEEPLNPYERLRHARSLFRILDRLTFRVWSVRPDAGDDQTEFSTELFQAGTRIGYTLHFRRGEGPDGADSWFLRVPPAEEMEDALTMLLEARGGELPYARQHHELQSPRDTMRTFLEQWEFWLQGHGDLFLRTMDLSQIPAAIRTEEGGLRAEFLKEVIDRIGRVLWQEIPDNPAQRGPYTHFLHPEGVVKILPVVQEDGSTLWQFSAETMASVRPLFMALEDMPFDETVVRGESTPFFEIRNQVRAINRSLLQEAGGVERRPAPASPSPPR